MFCKLYKKFVIVLCILSFSLLGIIYAFQLIIPDNFYSDSKNNLVYSTVYNNFLSFETDFEKTKSVFNQSTKTHSATVKLAGIFPVKEVSVTVADEKIVNVCGTPFGVKMFIDGVLVVGFSRIETEDGFCCPAKDSGLEEGDLIKAVNGKEVCTNEEVSDLIKSCKGNPVTLLVKRKNNDVLISVIPKMTSDTGEYKAGFWVRDSSAGIGTLTFYDPETLAFAGLGHGVCDVDTGVVIPFSKGEIVSASITEIQKGSSGNPGELGGVFTGTKSLGTINKNDETGIYGFLDYAVSGISVPVAHKQDIYEGPAVILSTIDGTEAIEYEIIIEKVNLSDNSLTKNMVIRVVDKDLISSTGGIVQGMSGSPIIQDGKLVGAVTHVLVNDPTRGYGIFIENMLEAAG